MTEKNTSQSQKSSPDFGVGFDPMTMVDTWKKLTDDTLSQMAAWMEQTGKLQQSGLEQWNRAVDERAQFFHDSLAHASRVSDEWRTMAVKATRRAADLVRS